MSDQLVVFDTSLLDKVWRGTTTPTVSSFQITVNGSHSVIKSTGAFSDNTLYLFNDSVTGGSEGYPAVVLVHHDDVIGGRMIALGFGPDVANEYGNRAFWASNPDGSTPTAAPPDMGIWQEQNSGGGGYRPHRRAVWFGSTHDTYLYGWSDGAETGPVGVYVNPSGNVGVGTSSLTTGAALTVNGAIHQTPQSWSVNKNNSDQTISSGGWVDVTWSTEEYDNGGIFTSNQATPTIAGIVSMNVMITFTSPQNGERLLAAVAKNGTRIMEIESDVGTGANTAQAICFTLDDVSDGNDVYKVQVFRSAGTSVGGGIVNTRFQGKVF